MLSTVQSLSMCSCPFDCKYFEIRSAGAPRVIELEILVPKCVCVCMCVCVCVCVCVCHQDGGMEVTRLLDDSNFGMILRGGGTFAA